MVCVSLWDRMPCWNLQLGNTQGYRKAAEVAHRGGSTSLRLIYCRTVTEKFSTDEVCFKAAKESLSHCKWQQDNLQHLHQTKGACLVLLFTHWQMWKLPYHGNFREPQMVHELQNKRLWWWYRCRINPSVKHTNISRLPLVATTDGSQSHISLGFK